MKSTVRIAVTGPPGCGKTTLIRRVVERLSQHMSIGGIYTEEVREDSERVGFAIVDIATGRRGTLAHVGLKSGPRFGKYRVHLHDLNTIAVPAIRAAAQSSDLIVIDEIAPMELSSPEFVQAVAELLRGTKPLLVAIHRRAEHPLLRRIRAEFTVYELTPHNRDRLVDEIVAAFTDGKGLN